MRTDRGESGGPVCAQGHRIATTYTVDDVRSRDVLVFYCATCDVRWEASPEERDTFLRYLESRPGDAVPP